MGDKKHDKAVILLKILCFLFFICLGMQGATQYIAYQFGYSQSLGEPLTRLKSGTPIYGFWKGIEWFSSLRSYYGKHDGITRTFGISGYIAAGSLLFSVVIMRLLFRKRGIGKGIIDLHGSARWANKEDIIEAALLNSKGRENEKGVVVGGWVDSDDKEDIKKLKVLRDNDNTHILVFAPTRSGKGVGLIIPTLLGEWNESTIILDIKGENWELTSGYKKSLGHYVCKFDPYDLTAATEGTSVTYNPFEEIELQYTVDFENNTYEDLRTNEISTISGIVESIANPDGRLEDNHWTLNARNVLVGAVTHLMYVGERNGYRPCLADIIEELTQPQEKYGDIFKAWLEYPHLGYQIKTIEKIDENGAKTTEEIKLPIVHPVVKAVALEMAPPGKPEDGVEGSGIVGSALTYIKLYKNPIIADNTRVSSFKISDLVNKDKPVHLYLVIDAKKLPEIRSLLRILFDQIINELATKKNLAKEAGRMVSASKHRLLFLLDEFPALGRLAGFKEAIGYFAGFGLKLYIITQDLSQLYGSYEKYDTDSIKNNCEIQIAYAAASYETAEMMSRQTGVQTIVKESVSTSGKRTDVFLDQTSVSMQEHSRPLLNVDECLRLTAMKKDNKTGKIIPGEMLIFRKGSPAILGRQALFFNDKILLERSQLPTLIKSDLDSIDKQMRIANIREKLRGESDEIRFLIAEMGALPKEDSRRTELQEKINKMKSDRINTFVKKTKQQSQSVGLPPR